MFESHLDSLTHQAKLPPDEAAVLERMMARVYYQLGKGRAFQVSSENLVWFFVRCQRWLGIDGAELSLLEKLKAAYGITPEKIAQDSLTENLCLRCGEEFAEHQMATLHCCISCSEG